MSLAILLVIAAIISLVVVISVGVSRLRFSGAREIQPVDIEAFRNLTDGRESEYLRGRLPGPEFRRIQRMRLRAMAAYVQAVGQNAVVLIGVGQLALRSNNSATEAAARRLINEALLLRRNAGLAVLRIYLGLAWPGAGFAATPILEGYQRLSGSAMLLGRLQNPVATVRLSA